MRPLLLLLLSFSMIGCSWFDKDDKLEPNPLPEFQQQISPKRVWSSRIGKESEVPMRGLAPSVDRERVYAASANGNVRAFDLSDGRTTWTADLDIAITAGPGVGGELVIVGGNDGEIVALSSSDGSVRWRAQASSEVLTPPVADDDRVVVRSQDGRLFAFDAATGTRAWVYDQSVPQLSLRGNARPVLNAGVVYVGFDNGKIVGLRATDGSLLWEQSVSKAQGRTVLDRLVDVDGDIALVAGDLYAVAYQGQLTSLTSDSGRLLWVRSFSSFQGIAVARTRLGLSDADDAVWAVDRLSGGSLWKQDQLLRRKISGPAWHGDYLVVGDYEGYLHWLEQEDGKFVGRARVDGGRVVSNPIVIGDLLIAQSQGGVLSAYRIN